MKYKFIQRNLRKLICQSKKPDKKCVGLGYTRGVKINPRTLKRIKKICEEFGG